MNPFDAMRGCALA